MNRWCALYVNSRAEKKVAEILTNKGIHSFVPLIKSVRQWSDRKKTIHLPLLSGYVFVNITPVENERVLQTKGVVAFVKSEGKIAEIREVEIDSLKQLVELGYQMESNPIKRNYNEGEKVKITSGVLRNVIGFVVEEVSERYLEIVLESIGQSIRVKLPKEIIIAV